MNHLEAMAQFKALYRTGPTTSGSVTATTLQMFADARGQITPGILMGSVLAAYELGISREFVVNETNNENER